MINVICLFAPAVLSVYLYERLLKRSLCKKGWLYAFTAFTILINAVCFSVKKFILGTGDVYIFALNAGTSPSIALHYLIMAVPVALCLPFVFNFVRTHFKFSVEETNSNN